MEGMGWGSGLTKMDERAELEEGEAYDDDTSIDLDSALSYLVRVLFCSFSV